MKKILTSFCAAIVVLLMFVSPGHKAEAASNKVTLNNDCGCDVTYILGAEKNKIVSDLIKNEPFKLVKMSLFQDGYTWNGVSGIEVVRPNNDSDSIGITVPFTDENGIEQVAVFVNGAFVTVTDPM